MKKLSLVLFAALLFTAGNIMAVDPTDKPVKRLAVQIQEMLENNQFDVSEDLTADVRFTINREGEIVVLSINTKNEQMVGFVKGRLNYKKVVLEKIEEGKIYTVPVRVTA